MPRSCNVVSDNLARFGCSLESGGVMSWPNGQPVFVNSLVAADLQSALS